MSTFADFLKNKKKSLVQEQGVIGGPFIDGILDGSGINNKMRDTGKAVGQGAKDTVIGVGNALGKGIKDRQGVKDTAIGVRDALGKGIKDTTTGIGRAIFGQNIGEDSREVRRNYSEAQTAITNYSNAIKNSPSLKNARQGQEIADRIQKTLQDVEDNLEATYNMYQKLEKRISPLNPTINLNLPNPQRGFIRPE